MKTHPFAAVFAAFISLSLGLLACGKAEMPKDSATQPPSNTQIVETGTQNTNTNPVETDDAKLMRFSTNFNVDKATVKKTAKDFNFVPGTFNASNIENPRGFYNFAANVDPTFGEFSQFLFSKDITFNGQIPSAMDVFSGTTDATKAAGKLVNTGVPKDFPVFRSTYLLAYAFRYTPKDKVGLATLKEAIRGFATNAAGFRRVSYTMAQSMGMDPSFATARGTEANSFVDYQVAYFKKAYEMNYRESGGGTDGGDASGAAESARATWADIEKSLREFFSNFVYRFDGKEYYPSVDKDANGRIEFSFVPFAEIGADADSDAVKTPTTGTDGSTNTNTNTKGTTSGIEAR
jgi:hypothetical protein